MSKSRRRMKRRSLFGETNRFPQGKLTEHDEGEIQFGITHKDGEVVLDFGKPVAWIGMPPALARQLSDLLRKHADEIEQNANQEGH